VSKEKSLPYLSPELCGLAEGAKIVGDQWILLILREAFYGVTRFETMRSHTGITKQTLATRLKLMTELGLLSRIPYREEGARERYEYQLTEKSRTLAPVLLALMEWGHRQVLHTAPHLTLVDKATGDPLHIGYVNTQGHEVKPHQVQIVPTPKG
ncbi:putative HTH-type transcriptional regulator, partial [Enterobacter cloacae]